MVACPTEAVWGLSCDPFDPFAVARLLRFKSRPLAKGLILVAADCAQLAFLLEELTARERETVSSTWPGPVTWLVPHRGRVPPWVHGAHDSVAVRVTDHPGLAALSRGFLGPLVTTSANPGGARPAKSGFQVRRYFGNRLDYVLPGKLGAADRPTVIRDLASGRTIRA